MITVKKMKEHANHSLHDCSGQDLETNKSREPREIHMLVTGFGSFTGYPKDSNPSFKIASALPPTLPPLNPQSPRIKLTLHPTAVPVVYSEVDHLTTEFYSAANGEYDFVVHTGVGFQFTLEGVAHREGYRGQDANGMFISERDGHPVFGRLTPEVLEIDVNVEDVMRRWRGKAPLGTNLYPSKNAGRYLCEYIYYSSLATLNLRKNRRTTAVFMHVPPPNDPPSIELGKKVLIALIYSLVECKSPEHMKEG